MKSDYRTRARAAVQRARQHIGEADEHSLRYACLDIRLAIEFLTYSLLEVYLPEVPDTTVKKWTPREVIGELLNADEFADKTVRLSAGIERTPGVLAEEIHELGEEQRLGRKEISRFHNAMGNFLHAPTLEQLEAGDIPTDKIRTKADGIVTALAKVLSSPIYNLNFGNFVTTFCLECQQPIKRRLESVDPKSGITCRISSCGAIYDLFHVNGQPQLRLRQSMWRCPKCKEELRLPVHNIKAGKIIACDCGARFQLCLGAKEVSANTDSTSADIEPAAESTSPQPVQPEGAIPSDNPFNLGSPNRMVRLHFETLRRTAARTQAEPDDQHKKQGSMIALGCAVAAVETFLNIYFRVLVSEPPYYSHRADLLRDLTDGVSLDHKLATWPTRILGRALDLEDPHVKAFLAFKQRRDSLFNFVSTHQSIHLNETTRVEGLADTAVFEDLTARDAMSAVAVAEGMVATVMILRGVDPDRVGDNLHLWTGKVPE